MSSWGRLIMYFWGKQVESLIDISRLLKLAQHFCRILDKGRTPNPTSLNDCRAGNSKAVCINFKLVGAIVCIFQVMKMWELGSAELQQWFDRGFITDSKAPEERKFHACELLLYVRYREALYPVSHFCHGSEDQHEAGDDHYGLEKAVRVL